MWTIASHSDYVLSRLDGEVYRSRAAALRDVRALADVVCVRFNGEVYVYSNRRDAYRDREGSAPHLCRAVIRRRDARQED